MKKSVTFGVVGLLVVAAAAYGWRVHSDRVRWLSAYNATSTCHPQDDEYFLQALRGNEGDVVSDASQFRTTVLVRMADDCTIKTPVGNPLVSAFDASFASSPKGEKEDIFSKMKDPSLFFTKRALSQDAEWGHLNPETITALAPTFALLPATRRAVITERYSEELRQAALAQRANFSTAVEALNKLALPRDAKDFGGQISLADNSLSSLSALLTVSDSTSPAISQALRNAAGALTKTGETFKPFMSNDLIQMYAQEEVLLGPEVVVLTQPGHYYLAVLPHRPKAGRVLVHVPADSGVQPGGEYNLWIRDASLKDMVYSDTHAWQLTYEVASSQERDNIETLRATAARFLASLQSIVVALSAPESEPVDSTGAVAGGELHQSPLQTAFEAQLTDLHSTKSTSEITQQDMDKLAGLLSQPQTEADWQFVAQLDADYSNPENECNTGDCAIVQSIVGEAEQMIKKADLQPPSGKKVSFKLTSTTR